ncbi:MAG: carboxypeptidase regulatory-like domain-containing protein [Cyanobacteria bacterium]|nr:carboxypeptidase regulatory-like domain-containing protein [Cyanobacteriota bacterium]
MRAVRPLFVAVICLLSLFWAETPSADQSRSKSAQTKTADPPKLRRSVPGRRAPGAGGAETTAPTVFEEQVNGRRDERAPRSPREQRMQRSGSFDGDLRTLPNTGRVRKRERPERHGPRPAPVRLLPPPGAPADPVPSGIDLPVTPLAAAPSPSASFEGLDFANFGAGHPPDTNGDVGPEHYIQSINSSIGIYDKFTGARVAAFTFDAFMSQGNFGNLCDTDNFGDPVVLYDTFEDRWVISDFAFTVDAGQNVINPPGAFECFAVSKTGDPVAGGWNFYSVNTTGGLGDYPKLGVWPDGIYMSVNMFDYAASGSFQNVRLYAFNKAQMYAGAASIQIVSFDVADGEFTLLPANARLQTGTPPAGAPNYFTSVWNFLNVVGVWKFHVDWDNISLSTLTGPFNSITSNNWSELTSATVPSPGNRLDSLFPRLMMQNQYSNIAGTESLWNAHTVGDAGATSARAAVRYYETRVAGATTFTTAQAFTFNPADTLNRFMPSVAVDRAGNMAIGYSATNATTFPAIRYAGRLAADPLNSITQTETTLIAGTGSQTGNCGGGSCERWGDYSAMSLDPDGCSFWYTNEYYLANGQNHRTRIGAFAFPACTPAGFGALQGTVKTTGAVPIAGATVMLGSRTTTTDASGNYSFADLPAGAYPIVTAAFAGFNSSTFTSIVINTLGTTTRDFTLAAAPLSGCLTDSTQSDFQRGVVSNCDLTSSPGNVTLLNAANVNQQNLTVTANGFGMNATNWAGQTFTPSVTGTLTRVDLDLFCSGCTGTTPNLTVSIRATTTTGNRVPTGPDLATATIPGFSSGAGGYFSAVFATPPALTAGTRYAVIVRPVSNPSAGIYAYVCSCAGIGAVDSNPYPNGQRVISATSGATWAADTTVGGRDLGFITYMQTGFAGSGTFISSTKDANAGVGRTATWGAITWTATTPAGTTATFQVAASNNPNGPFNFVGPSGTAATSFTNGASLAQFNGRRYLKYKITLTTSNSGVTPTVMDVQVCFNNVYDDPTVTTLLLSGGNRLQQLQNPDGGWYFRATDTSCGAGAGVSCPNIIGVTALGLISAYQRSGDLTVLADAVAAGELLKSVHTASPLQQPFSQDLEFLVALSDATADPQYAALASSWFGTVTSAFPIAANRVTWQLDGRNTQGLRTLAVWDLASLVRSAKAAGNIGYASGLASAIIAQEAQWKDVDASHRWDQCASPSGCGPAGNALAFDYTLLGMGSLLWAMHDLPGFDVKINEYRSWLLSQQDAAGSWDVGDLQITSYVAMGLGAVGGTGTNAAIQSAVSFFLAHQLPAGGWPFSFVNGVAGREYAMVDSEVMRAIATLYGTQAGAGVTVTPSQLASVTFSEVTTAGETTVVALAAAGTVPAGYSIVEGLTYEVETTASIAGTSTICFRPAVVAGLSNVRILHKEGDAFVDRTTSANCAATTSLKTFAIARFDASAIDTEAPRLTVTLSPSVIRRANNRLVTIRATINVTDNADPAPAITLVSITESGDNRNRKADVEDAAFGTDDRVFRVRAESGRTDHVYTVVYRATDRSGNATDVSSRVVVRKN